MATSEVCGDRIVLVPVTTDHVAELRRILRTPEVWRRWGDEAASALWPFDDPSADGGGWHDGLLMDLLAEELE